MSQSNPNTILDVNIVAGGLLQDLALLQPS